MAGVRVDKRTGVRVGHALCLLRNYREGELCPDALQKGNADGRWDGKRCNKCTNENSLMDGIVFRLGKERAENGLVVRKGMPSASEPLRVC